MGVIIVEDDELDRLLITSFVKRIDAFEIIDIYENAEQVLERNNFDDVDCMFLDIDLPGISGLALREKLKSISICVFITSHPDYAVDSFEAEALDFLVKPIHFNRFEKTYERINDYLELSNKAELYDNFLGNDVIFIKVGNKEIKIKLHEVLYLEGLKDYTQIVLKEKNTVCYPILERYYKMKSLKLLLEFIEVMRFKKV
ncbi:response regulator transcription factor [Flavobacterium piscinae]|uniref:LytR/AlgR family response regulator transcription factor n=1 Tax=Flavobacterium piscinae TaxID=2506424 RepID=UPI0019A8DD3B|nr:LytTR family DNA-binding domain-containing protein [Flavobacterium piscinae]MBC8883909.1 response regulator transcription factor [Flavobacterium piscinae]